MAKTPPNSPPDCNGAGAADEQRFDALWPRSPRQQRIRPLAKRLDTLNGKTVAHLWDYMFRGDEVFEILEEALKKRYPTVRFVHWKEFGSTHSPQEHQVIASLPGKFKALGVDAVISGMGS